MLARVALTTSLAVIAALAALALSETPSSQAQVSVAVAPPASQFLHAGDRSEWLSFPPPRAVPAATLEPLAFGAAMATLASTRHRCEGSAPSAYEQLAAVTFHNRNGDRTISTRLYLPSGCVDEAAATALDDVLADTRDPKQPKVAAIDRRLLQLLYRAAYHFGASRIEVTSAFRAPTRRREGLHALGRAIDFTIPGVKPTVLASYLRRLPRVGVGIYTHRRTRFVHLDVREQSYHWLDASPPGRTWRGLSIGGKDLAARDAAYLRATDWPEGLEPPDSH